MKKGLVSWKRFAVLFAAVFCLAVFCAPQRTYAAKSSLSVSEIQTWLKGKENKQCQLKGTQCVALFNEYLQYLWGIDCNAWPVASAYQIFNYSAPSGWSKVAKPSTYQVGDIVIWGYSSQSQYNLQDGHVGVVYSVSGSTVKVAEQTAVTGTYKVRIANLYYTNFILGVFRPPLTKTFTVKYHPNGGTGSMADTVITYGVEKKIRKNTFTRVGYTFGGWTVYRHYDGKWRYQKGSETGWYKKGSQPSGYTPYVYTDQHSISKTSDRDGDIVDFYAVWNPCSHKWDSGKVTKAATQDAEGVRTYTCTVCKQTKTEAIPKLHTHIYEISSRTPATCTGEAVTVYKCSCGKGYTVRGDVVTYGEWSTAKPTAGKNQVVETKTQYRSAVRSLDWQKTGSGTIDYAASWTAGFNKSNSLYTKYNKTPKKASETSTDKVTVSTAKIGYIYYHWCQGANLEHTYNRTIESTKTSTHKTFHAFYSTADLALTTSANARKKDNYSVCKDTYWWLNERITINRCTYTTYKKAAVGAWGAWSAWQDAKITAGDATKVETRTLYRLKTTLPGKPTGHNYGEWVKQSDGSYKRVCRNDASHVETAANREATLPNVNEEEARILNDATDEAPADVPFHLLRLRFTKAAKTYIKLKWTKVEGAKTYRLYGARCGSKYKKIADLTKTAYTAKKLKKGKYYKYYVIAVSSGNKVLAQSKTVHVATAGGKYGNYKSVKLKNVKKKTLTLTAGKSFPIKASAVKASKKVREHRKLAYESTKPEVATVSKKGKIKAKKAGTTTIYVYSQSGTYAKFKVKVTK